MSNCVLQYFYAPTWDYPPAGPIKLGNVLMSIKKPENPLFTAPLPTAEEVFTMNKTDVEFSTEKLNGGHLTILTKFLSIFGLGVDTGVQWDRRCVLIPPVNLKRRSWSLLGASCMHVHVILSRTFFSFLTRKVPAERISSSSSGSRRCSSYPERSTSRAA